MLNIKKEIKRGIAIGLAALTMTSVADADIINGNGETYQKGFLDLITKDVHVEIDRHNKDLNRQAAENAVKLLKNDIEGMDDLKIYIADTQEKNIMGLYFQDSYENDIIIMNNEDLSYLKEIMFTDEYYEYIQMEIGDRELTVFHEVAHHLTINHLTDEQLQEYEDIYNYHFDGEDWDCDIYENIAEDLSEFFVKKYYGTGLIKDTINEEVERDQEALDKWIIKIIAQYNNKYLNLQKEFYNLVDK